MNKRHRVKIKEILQATGFIAFLIFVAYCWIRGFVEFCKDLMLWF